MAFSRPTKAQLVERVLADLEAELPGADVRLRRSFENIIGKVLAGVSHAHHGHLVYLSKQIIPDTAEDSFLVRWASIWNIIRKDAEKATGRVAMTGTNDAVCEAGEVWQRADGVRFVVDENATIVDGEATVMVTAESAGALANTDESSPLTLVSPVAGIDSTALVGEGGIAGGVDTESLEALLVRLLQRTGSPPKGGGPGDYIAWCTEVSGVTRAWELPLYQGEGTVLVLFVLDALEDIIPDEPKVAEVQAYIDARRPVTAKGALVAAPIGAPLNFTLGVTPDTPAVREAVEAELRDLVARSAAPGVTIPLSHLNEAISLADGETDHNLTSPSADVTHAAIEIPVFGTVTWI